MPHAFNPTILREYDIRGIVGDTLHEADAYAIGRTFGSIVREREGQFVGVGYDGRVSSPALEAALVRGLSDAGIDVVRIGIGPTPMLYWSVYALGLDGGIQVTGSHNPPSHNGFKMMLGNKSFYGADIKALGERAAAGDWTEGQGAVSTEDVEDRYVDRLMQDFDGHAFRVGWDAGNGSAGRILDKLVKRLPGEHHTLYTDIDGNFPNHHPDPTVEANLADLQRLVADKGLDFGIAFDGDGDRIGAVDGQGRVVWGDQLLSIYAEPVLQAVPGATIIADVKASQMLFDRIAELGGQPLMWKTGHSLIKTKMVETGAPLAGEMSGHIFFAHQWYGFDDALYCAVRLIRAVSQLGGSLTALRDRMPAFVNTPEMRFDVADERKFAVVDEMRARLAAAGAAVDGTDGVRVNTPDGWWLIRASNTQAALSARAEAVSQAALDRLVAAIHAQLTDSGVEAVLSAGH